MTCACAEIPQTSLYRALTVPVDVRKTYRHHLTGHKLYHRIYEKSTDITREGTNCTCGCAENLQTSPHRVQTVPVDVLKTHRHHLTRHKLYLCMCRKPKTSLHRAQNVPVHVRKIHRHHHTEYKLYLWMCRKLRHYHTGHKLYL
jgi:hypothetical protein